MPSLNRRQRVALTLPPLLLRVMLAVVFIWAGLTKVASTMPVKGERAAVLANMGVRIKPTTPAPENATPSTPPKAPSTQPAAPEQTKPEPARPQSPPAEKAPAEPAQPPSAPPQTKPDTDAPTVQPPSGDSAAAAEHEVITTAWRPQQDRPAPKPAAGADESKPAESSKSSAAGKQKAAHTYTAADFPEPVQVKPLYGVALAIHGAANPAPNAEGVTPMRLWPAALGQGARPKWQAWAVALTELVGGAFLLMGLLTRLSALGIVSVMLGAMWLTQFGPFIQQGNAVLGFLPNHPFFAMQEWTTLLFQFALLMSALAVLFAGPGRPAVDGALFGSHRSDDDLDDL